MKRCWILIILCLLMLPQAAQAGTYYVDRDSLGGACNDANPGTLNQPWCNISKANSALQAGDTVYVRQGTYSEIIEPYRSGAAGNKITYKAYPGEDAKIIGEEGIAPVVTVGYPVHGSAWDNKSYIVIDGFKIEHNDRSYNYTFRPTGIIFYGENSTHNEAINNEINCVGLPIWQGGNTHAITISKADNNLIQNNTISGLCRVGILVGSVAQYNLIKGNSVTGVYSNSLNFGSSEGVMQYNIVEDNCLCGSLTQDSIQFENRYDLPEGQVDDGSNQGVLIRNNTLCAPAENNIDLKGASNIIIEKNIIYGGAGNNDGGLRPDQPPNRDGNLGGIMHGSGTSSKNVIIRNNVLYDNQGGILPENGYKIYNNILVYNNRDYLGTNQSYNWTRKPYYTGITAWSGLENTGIINNIIGGQNSAELALVPNSGNPYINNNLYFSENGARLVEYRGKYDWDILSFEDWKLRLQEIPSVSGKDTQSIEADPLFVNVPEDITGSYDNFDFHLQQNSPAIDAGAFLTKTTGSGGGTAMMVEDARYFFDGWGIVEGDFIQLEGSSQRARIISADYSTNTLTLQSALTWSDGQGVGLSYEGSAPDIGAYEYVPHDAVLYGDVSVDSEISAYDAALTAQAAVGLIILTAEQTQKADVSGDSEVNAYDAALIAQYSVGIITRFPVEG